MKLLKAPKGAVTLRCVAMHHQAWPLQKLHGSTSVGKLSQYKLLIRVRHYLIVSAAVPPATKQEGRG